VTLPNFTLGLGPADYGKRKGTAGVIFHTTEPATHDTTIAAALNTAKWQAGNSTGSYNFIVADSGIVSTVPFTNSSGGVNPGSPSYKPEPWLKALLSPAAFADPNAYHVQISLQGRVDGFARNGYPDKMVEWGAELILLVERTFGINAVVSGHQHWQTNRSDPGQQYIDLVLERYQVMTTKPSFSDVPPEHPFYADIEWAKANGISAGTGNGKYSPDRPVTRAEMAAFLHRASKVK